MINIVDAKYIDDFRLQLLFEINDYTTNKKDRVQKVADLEEYLMSKKDSDVFVPLKNIEFFRHFKLNANTIEWENGADIAPERIYEIAK
jgi:hypothetical protein